VAWTDTFDETTDWSAVSFLNMFTTRLWEMAYAINPGIPPTFPVSAGDDVQGQSFIAGLQGYITPNILGFGGGNYIRPTFDPNGQPADPLAGDAWIDLSPWWSGLPEVQAAAGYSDQLDAFGRTYAISEADTGWVRKKPRAIATTADTKDTDGNPISNGMRAELQFDGTLYVRTAGVWVATDYSGGPPDLLVSAPGNPRTITGTSDAFDTAGNAAVGGMRAELGADVYIYDGAGTWVLDAGTLVGADRLQTGSGCAYGTCQAGDYIGPWIWNQLRDVLVAIGKRTDFIPSTSDQSVGVGESHYDDITGSEPVFTTEAAAYADASGRWTYGAGGSGSQAIVTMSSQGTVHSQFPSIVANEDSAGALYTVSTADHVAKTIHFIGAFHAPGDSPLGFLDVYDGQGEAGAAAAEDTFNTWESVPVAAGTTDGSSFFPTSFAPPPNYTDLPQEDPAQPDYVVTRTGFEVGQTRAIIEWDFTYGP
jgi:hypothetical protein